MNEEEDKKIYEIIKQILNKNNKKRKLNFQEEDTIEKEIKKNLNMPEDEKSNIIVRIDQGPINCGVWIYDKKKEKSIGLYNISFIE